MAASPENVANELIGRLEQAWNEADGRAFGEPFSADANFVDPPTTYFLPTVLATPALRRARQSTPWTS
jgi:hypothetical protein